MITLTDKAAVKVKQLLESENATDLALRVAVRPGGCSGYSYEMFFDGEFAADDVVAKLWVNYRTQQIGHLCRGWGLHSAASHTYKTT